MTYVKIIVAGAGIGGKGGSGGAGGGAKPSTKHVNRDEVDGINGNAGGAGTVGGDSGTLYFLGTITVSGTGGAAGAGGAGGAGGDALGPIDATGTGHDYACYGGGGGGGGGGGSVAAGIGAGGNGAPGGGSGGAGGVAWRAIEDYVYKDDYWGHGGHGGGADDTDGNRGRTNAGKSPWTATGGRSNPGNGGQAGDALSGHGNDGTAYRSASAVVTGRSSFAGQNATGHEAIRYAITFTNLNDCLYSCPPRTDVYLGMPYPKVDSDCTTVDPDKILEGWYTAATGGEKIYGADGVPVEEGMTYEHYEGDLTLYPHLSDAAQLTTGVSIDGVAVGGPDDSSRHGDGWTFSGGTVTLTGKSDASAYDLAGTNRLGRLKFLVPSGSNTVCLSGLCLRNDRPGIGGVVDVAPGASLVIDIRAPGNELLTAGDAAAVHCPEGAFVSFRSSVTNLCARQDGDRDELEDAFFCIIAGASPDVCCHLSLRAGAGAAEIGGCKGELCGDISFADCCFLVPCEKLKALSGSVHAVGHGELDPETAVARGGAVTIGRNASFVAKADDADWAAGKSDDGYPAVWMAFPRPHDGNGIPLTPVDHCCRQAGGAWFRYFFLSQPGKTRVFVEDVKGDVEGDGVDYFVPRSGDPVREH